MVVGANKKVPIRLVLKRIGYRSLQLCEVTITRFPVDHTGLLHFARDLFGSACWGRAVASGGTPRGLGFSVTCYAARLLRGELSLLGKG